MVLRYVEAKRLGRGTNIGITAVAFSPRGKYLAAAALDGKVRIWSIETGEQLYVFSSTVPMLSLEWAGPQEDAVLCGLQDGSICCLVVTQVDLEVKGFRAHSHPVEHLAARGGLLASGAHEEVRVWRPSSDGSGAWILDAVLLTPNMSSFNRHLQVVVTSTSWIGGTGGRAHLLVTYLNHGAHIFDTETMGLIRTIPILGQIADASISSDEKLIAISNVLTGFDVCSIETGATICSVGHTVSEYRKIPVLFVHDAVALLGGNLQGDVHLWDVGSGRKLHSLTHPKDDQILALAAHYDSASDTFMIATGVLVGSSEYAVVLWKAEELGQQEELHGAHGWLTRWGPMFYAGMLLPAILASFFILHK